MNLFDVIEGKELRDAGIKQAVDHAEAIHPGWNEEAYDLLKKFLNHHSGQFQCEDVRAYAAMVDFPLPPNARAWGGVFNRAIKSQLIHKIGIGPVKNKTAHCANANIYENKSIRN